jgi:hypothetical protein
MPYVDLNCDDFRQRKCWIGLDCRAGSSDLGAVPFLLVFGMTLTFHHSPFRRQGSISCTPLAAKDHSELQSLLIPVMIRVDEMDTVNCCVDGASPKMNTTITRYSRHFIIVTATISCPSGRGPFFPEVLASSFPYFRSSTGFDWSSSLRNLFL